MPLRSRRALTSSRNASIPLLVLHGSLYQLSHRYVPRDQAAASRPRVSRRSGRESGDQPQAGPRPWRPACGGPAVPGGAVDRFTDDCPGWPEPLLRLGGWQHTCGHTPGVPRRRLAGGCAPLTQTGPAPAPLRQTPDGAPEPFASGRARHVGRSATVFSNPDMGMKEPGGEPG